jgi:hypothetical protein
MAAMIAQGGAGASFGESARIAICQPHRARRQRGVCWGTGLADSPLTGPRPSAAEQMAAAAESEKVKVRAFARKKPAPGEFGLLGGRILRALELEVAHHCAGLADRLLDDFSLLHRQGHGVLRCSLCRPRQRRALLEPHNRGQGHGESRHPQRREGTKSPVPALGTLLRRINAPVSVATASCWLSNHPDNLCLASASIILCFDLVRTADFEVFAVLPAQN